MRSLAENEIQEKIDSLTEQDIDYGVAVVLACEGEDAAEIEALIATYDFYGCSAICATAIPGTPVHNVALARAMAIRDTFDGSLCLFPILVAGSTSQDIVFGDARAQAEDLQDKIDLMDETELGSAFERIIYDDAQAYSINFEEKIKILDHTDWETPLGDEAFGEAEAYAQTLADLSKLAIRTLPGSAQQKKILEKMKRAVAMCP